MDELEWNIGKEEGEFLRACYSAMPKATTFSQHPVLYITPPITG